MFTSIRFWGIRPVRAVAATTGSVALALGAVFAGSATAAENESQQEMLDTCPQGALCIWEEPHAGGQQINLATCDQRVNLHDNGHGGVGSFVNNQTPDLVAGFFGPLPEDPEGPPQHQYDSVAPDIREDTTNLNTYEVQPC